MKEEISDKSQKQDKQPVVHYVHSTNLVELFRQQRFSLLVSTYQAQRILAFSPGQARLSMLMRTFERPTGITVEAGRMALCTRREIWFFDVPSNLRDEHGVSFPYDVCYVPRRCHVTGDISGHEIAWCHNKFIVVNTRFSCLSTITPEFSFLPTWKPPFISDYAAEDRCHLNGMAANSSGPQYVTALGESDTQDGWREGKDKGGCIIHVPTGEIVSRGLAMPHSPRLYANKLWVLESGTGELQVVDIGNGIRETVIALPGYLRGLAFYGNYAFVGLCKIREKSVFGGLPIEARIKNLKCAIYVIDIRSGNTVGFIEFTKGIEELFDIIVLPNILSPHIIGFEEDTINGLFVLPS